MTRHLESLHTGGYHPGDLDVSQAMGALRLSSEWDMCGRIRIVLNGPDDRLATPVPPTHHFSSRSRDESIITPNHPRAD